MLNLGGNSKILLKGVINLNRFGNVLKTLRTSNNIKQADLAKTIGVSASTIGMYEQGRREPDFDILQKIADYFNVSIDYLIGKAEKSDSRISEKDEKDIAKTMKKLKEQLSNNQGLLFDGNILDEDTSRLLLEAIEQQERMIKKINKKYTPKKYIK